MRITTNQKYEITDIVHETYPFLHRIRAVRDIGSEVKKGDLGGFVEREENLSFESGDDAWIFGNAIAAGNSYVDQNACLLDEAVACDNAYISHGAKLSGSARAEDDAYIRGATLKDHARASGNSMILVSPDTHLTPVLSDSCAVYGSVSGDVLVLGKAVIISGEEIRNDTLDTLVISHKGRSVMRDPSRDELSPSVPSEEKERAKKTREVVR